MCIYLHRKISGAFFFFKLRGYLEPCFSSYVTKKYRKVNGQLFSYDLFPETTPCTRGRYAGTGIKNIGPSFC